MKKFSFEFQSLPSGEIEFRFTHPGAYTINTFNGCAPLHVLDGQDMRWRSLTDGPSRGSVEYEPNAAGADWTLDEEVTSNDADHIPPEWFLEKAGKHASPTVALAHFCSNLHSLWLTEQQLRRESEQRGEGTAHLRNILSGVFAQAAFEKAANLPRRSHLPEAWFRKLPKNTRVQITLCGDIWECAIRGPGVLTSAATHVRLRTAVSNAMRLALREKPE